jgi:hypothetical protein
MSFNNYGNKKKYIKKIQGKSQELHDLVISSDFQEWLDVLRQIRDTSAHREMFALPTLLITTPQSQLSDEEIDAIIYKDHPPIDNEIKHLLSKEQIQNRIDLDRHDFRVSKMKKGLEQFAVVKDRNNKEVLIDPIARMTMDIENLNRLIETIATEHKKYKKMIK